MMIAENVIGQESAWCSVSNLLYHSDQCYHEDSLGFIPSVGVSSETGFKSGHPGGMNGLFVDATVKFFRNDVNKFIIRCWVNRMDGDVIPAP
jgi:prepilin-type processing-associated H-X9-DG protein